jgi:hypothetical protein
LQGRPKVDSAEFEKLRDHWLKALKGEDKIEPPYVVLTITFDPVSGTWVFTPHYPSIKPDERPTPKPGLPEGWSPGVYYVPTGSV